MRNLFSLIFLVIILSCGDNKTPEGPPIAPKDCPWFQQCGPSASGGSCGTCDDGDPCTEDRCIAGITCGHIPLEKSCQCEGDCTVDAGKLTYVQSLTLGQGGLAGLNGLSDIQASNNGQHLYVAAADSGAVTHLIVNNSKPVWASTAEVGDVRTLFLSTDNQRMYALGDSQLVVLLRDKDLGTLTVTNNVYPGGKALAGQGGWLVTAANSSLTLYSQSGDELIYKHEAKDPALKDSRSVSFSPDGKQIYAAGYAKNTLTTWSIAGGQLKKIDETSSVRGLKSPEAVVVSPDGQHVYVAGFCDHDVAIFARDPSTGLLTAVGSAWKGADVPSDCMVMDLEPEGRVARPTALNFTPDGKRLVVASGSLGAPDVTIFDRAGDSLTWIGELDETTLAEPVAMARFDFVAARWGDSPPDTLDQLRGVTSIAVTAEHVFVASSMTNALETVPISEDGLKSVHTLQHGQGGIWGIAGCHELDMSPDGRHIYVAPRNQYSMGAFELNPKTGGITELATPVFPSSGDEPGVIPHVEVVGTDGREVLAADAINAVLHVFDRDGSTGELTHRKAHQLPDCDGHKPFVVGVRASVDASSVYVSDFQVQGESCLLHYQREPDGSLAHRGSYNEPFLKGIEGFELTKDGKHVYTANHIASSVGHYRRDESTGVLSAQPAVIREDLLGAEALAFSPDEKHIYVTSPRIDDLVVFARDLETGTLTHKQTVVDDANIRLGGALGLVTSPDGKWLYVAAHHADSLNVFEIQDDGSVSFHQRLHGMDSLLWVNYVRTSPAGDYVYVVALQASAVTVFRKSDGMTDGCGNKCP